MAQYPTQFITSKIYKELTDSALTILDGGARGGLNKRWDAVKDRIFVYGTEPDQSEIIKLNESASISEKYLPIALYNKKGSFPLYITNKPACISLIESNMQLMNRFQIKDEFIVNKKTTVQCDTIDNLINAQSIGDIDILKLDTQGSEFEILEGAEKALRNNIVAVDIEVEFSRMYKNQSLFKDIDPVLTDKGFVLFDFLGNFGRAFRNSSKNSKNISRGQVLWAHVLYLKDPLSSTITSQHRLSKNKALKLVATAEMYNLSDYAIELVKHYSQLNVISYEEEVKIVKLLTKNIKIKSKLEKLRSIVFLNLAPS